MSDAVATENNPVVLSNPKALWGQKIGMTQVFTGTGQIVPVTVVKIAPCYVSEVLSQAKHGYSAIRIAFGDVKEKNLNRAQQGVYKKTSIPARRWMREVRVAKSEDFAVGQALKADVFATGQFVDVTGYSKGKGFAGVMKRHNFRGGPATHGQSDRARAPGSSGSNTYPGRVFKGKKFPGHLGVEKTTVQHLEVVDVKPEDDFILIRGAVPGAKGSLVYVAETVKRIKKRVIHVVDEKKSKAAKKDVAKAPAAKAKAGK